MIATILAIAAFSMQPSVSSIAAGAVKRVLRMWILWEWSSAVGTMRRDAAALDKGGNRMGQELEVETLPMVSARTYLGGQYSKKRDADDPHVSR